MKLISPRIYKATLPADWSAEDKTDYLKKQLERGGGEDPFQTQGRVIERRFSF